MIRHGIRYKYHFKCRLCQRFTLSNIKDAGICDDCLDREDEKVNTQIVLLEKPEERMVQ